jgi:hypothetical protein
MAVKRSKQLLWFVLLWVAGVCLLAIVAMMIKAVIL